VSRSLSIQFISTSVNLIDLNLALPYIYRQDLGGISGQIKVIKAADYLSIALSFRSARPRWLILFFSAGGISANVWW
jgi:hypothetical protein